MSITINCLKNALQSNPALNWLFKQNYKPYNLILEQPYASITPFLVGFAKYFCTHSLLLNSFR